MTKWKFRSCPRCNGDIYVERDNDETYERCLQCGYVKLTNSFINAYHYALEQDNEYTDSIQRSVMSGNR